MTVLFADLAGFTAFSEGRPAGEVIEMLNAYWGAVVPHVVDDEGGYIERFAGDAILTVFNALGDQPDHATRAVRAAIAVRDRSDRARAGHDWPRFRVGVNTGVVVIGNVGAGTQRLFAAIGDTTNVAARLQSLSMPGHITIGGRTLDEVNDEPGVVINVRPLGAADLKGKSEPTNAFELLVAEVTTRTSRERDRCPRQSDRLGRAPGAATSNRTETGPTLARRRHPAAHRPRPSHPPPSWRYSRSQGDPHRCHSRRRP